MKIQLSKITKYQEKQCKLFSEFSVTSSLDEYEKRNQSNKDKITTDIYNGKEAEFMVYNFLISSSKKLNSPDLNIYDKFNKSYDADLVLKNANIHVKSHKVNSNFPVSWVFQKNDPLLVYRDEKDFLALVVINNDISYMYLNKISEVQFKEPIKESLKETKLCIYEKDLL